MTTALISALTLERINKFLNSADGRDKFFRTVQYLTRFLSWHFQQKGNKAAAENATKISAAMSDGRTLLRLLKWLNEWQKYRDTVKGFMAAKKEGSRPEDRDIVTFVLTTLRAVGNEGYFFFDNMMWLSKYRLASGSPPFWFKLGFRFWLLAIGSQILLDVYSVGRGVLPLGSVRALRQFSKNLADLPVAINGSFDMGWSNGLTGLLGIWSSLVTVYELWP